MDTNHPVSIDIGIGERGRKEIADGLAHFLADTYTLYLKTHNFHWNITGSMFRTLHLMFEEQYNELWQAVDLVAERIRALGFRAPGTYREFTSLSSITEEEGAPPADEMVALLTEGHQTVARTARSLFPVVERNHDQATLDLLTERLRVHEKTAWMLRSLLS